MVDDSKSSSVRALLTQSTKNTVYGGDQDGLLVKQELTPLIRLPKHFTSRTWSPPHIQRYNVHNTIDRQQNDLATHTRTKPNHTTTENQLKHIHIMNTLLHNIYLDNKILDNLNSKCNRIIMSRFSISITFLISS